MQMKPTDDDIDEDVRNDPPGIDDDDEIDAGITPAQSKPSSHRVYDLRYNVE
jgi:hypothetical protein